MHANIFFEKSGVLPHRGSVTVLYRRVACPTSLWDRPGTVQAAVLAKLMIRNGLRRSMNLPVPRRDAHVRRHARRNIRPQRARSFGINLFDLVRQPLGR